ncbi:2-succinyl-5-enolpyruvyl-6-hydroxy-3-cyclohexene-1-carboxylic-acid synthase [Leucobacter soli]|uniref:2-succinyl-5-enolpyruvyl-6-hydroxy-3- cyclohexene-1-carboxylic-acid synthase n=1 Tax=Leucobacter soli TaxID=2812850 RepID=UPI00360CFCBE
MQELVADAYERAVGDIHGPGPAHLNIGFRDPLSGGPTGLAEDLARGRLEMEAEHRPGLQERLELVCCEICGPEPEAVEACTHRRATELECYVHGSDGAAPLAVVVAGADAGPVASDFAHAAGLPLLAEPSSGARFGREAIQHWEELLADPGLAAEIERVIVFGSPTLTRAVPALVRREGVETVVVDSAGPDGPPAGAERFNPGRSVGAFALSAAVAEGYDPAAVKPWLGAWVIRDRELRAARTTVHAPDLEAARATGYKDRSAYARAEVAVLRESVTREHLCEALWLATWPHDRLVLAASRLIRVMNRMAPPRSIPVHANRGLAGIDGTVATALGIAVASQASDSPAQAAGTTRVLLGDLALLHDAGSLLLPSAVDASGEQIEPLPRVQVFVGNDGGGTIFDGLEAAGTAGAQDFERVMYTPQRADLRALAEAYGWAYERIEDRGALDRLLTAPVTGPALIEVPLAR